MVVCDKCRSEKMPSEIVISIADCGKESSRKANLCDKCKREFLDALALAAPPQPKIRYMRLGEVMGLQR